MNARFSERVAYITGAGSGIGRATADLFAAEGAKVLAVDVDGDAVTRTVGRIRSSGGTALGAVCDVSSFESVAASVEYAVQELGGLGVLVNAAGVGRAARLEEIDASEWERTIGVNLTGAFHTTRAALPHLLGSANPAIVNVASVAGLRGQAYCSPYCASKAGLINFTRSVALEFASRGMRANCIAPGGVRTPFIKTFMPRDDFEPQLLAYYSPPVRNQLGEPEDFAKQIAFLVSDEARTINGAVLVGDGGMTA